MKTPTRVLCIYAGVIRQPGACEIYRGSMPLEYLGKQEGWLTEWMYFESLWNDFQRYGVNAFANLLENDIIIFPRLYVPTPEVIEPLALLYCLLRSAGKRIIYETDDDYTNEHRQVVAGDAMLPAKWADAITVTTPMLAKTMNQRTDRPTHILPNCIDPRVWSKPNLIPSETLAGKTVIGLTGSATHENDWKVLAPVMRDVLLENPQAHLLLMGFHPDYLLHLPNTSYLPGLEYFKYAQVIRHCDIILAPVDPLDNFNLGKSPIKAIEGQAAQRILHNSNDAGAAVIATDNPVYRLAVKHGKTGLLVPHTPGAWKEALNRLIQDNHQRQQLQMAGHKSAYGHYDMSHEWVQWARAYRTVLARPANNIALPLSPKG